MRVLFDQGTPVPLRRFLNSHTVTTVYEKGWSRTRNGDLLRLADQEMFEVFLTTDEYRKNQFGWNLQVEVFRYGFGTVHYRNAFWGLPEYCVIQVRWNL